MVGGDVAEEVVRVPEICVARTNNGVVRGSMRERAVSDKLSEATAEIRVEGTERKRGQVSGERHCVRNLSGHESCSLWRRATAPAERGGWHGIQSDHEDHGAEQQVPPPGFGPLHATTIGSGSVPL